MPNYLISGLPGSGKSTVINALAERGYAAYDTDKLNEVTKLEDIETGRPVVWPDGPIDFTKYAWNWQEAGLRDLLNTNEIVFVGASVSNQEKFHPLFTKIFVLMISPEQLTKRLTERSTNTYGKQPAELDRILRIKSDVERGLLDNGALPIDASKTVEQVVHQILQAIDSEPRVKE